MGKVVAVIAFLFACLTGRLLLLALLFQLENNQFDFWGAFNGWTAYVVTATGLGSYMLSFGWLKGRKWWATALVTACVATLVFLPGVDFAHGVGTGLSMVYVFVEWAFIGVAAHWTTLGALAISERYIPRPKTYW